LNRLRQRKRTSSAETPRMIDCDILDVQENAEGRRILVIATSVILNRSQGLLFCPSFLQLVTLVLFAYSFAQLKKI
jgi:7,8-dihydro-6-hydroxymethylpterin-pyrophosphokinase